jgi:RNA polymerase sigma factor (sigma-70 family)
MQQAAWTGTDMAATSDGEFANFYLRNYRQAVVLAYATTASLALAEEIAQDAFLQLYRRWDKVTAKDAWLRRAVLSLSTSWLRRHLVERRLVPAPADPPDTIAQANLRLILNVLSPRQRAAVVLRFFDGLGEREIAAALDCRPGTVKSLLSRSIRKLQKEFDHARRS